MCGILAVTYDSDDADVSKVKLATRVLGDFLVCGRLCDIYISKAVPLHAMEALGGEEV
jgi:hypothetical protein